MIGLPSPNSYFKKFLIELSNPLDHTQIGIPTSDYFDTFDMEETLLMPEFTTSVDSDT